MQWDKYQAKSKLTALVKNCRKPPKLKDTVTANSTIAEIELYIPVNQYNQNTPGWRGTKTFKVHADCHRDVLSDFLAKATDDNICIVKGPKNALKLGLDGQALANLQIYLKA